MVRVPPISTRTDTSFPDTTLCRAPAARSRCPGSARPSPAGRRCCPSCALLATCRVLLPLTFSPVRARQPGRGRWPAPRSEEHTSELQSLMRISYAVFCLKKKNTPFLHKSLHHHSLTTDEQLQ